MEVNIYKAKEDGVKVVDNAPGKERKKNQRTRGGVTFCFALPRSESRTGASLNAPPF